MRVFLAWHTHADGLDDNAKLLGVYSTRELAEAAVDRSRSKPGFRLYPRGFEIVGYDVDRDEWTEGFGLDDPAT